MKRWNGWGSVETDYPLPAGATAYLVTLIGEGKPQLSASIENILAQIPPSRLVPHRLIQTDPAVRLRHARGQSLPDWVALRSGRIGVFPDGVAFPESDEDVRQLLQFASQSGAHLIPYGGGTSVVGHINPLPGATPVLTVDLSRLNELLDLDETSHLATFGAGARGPDLESQLRPRGFTLGHFPQSFEYSTLGGWIATRSSGQQSAHYGRIEALFAGGRLETLGGTMDLPPLPASAAGPDLRQIVLGSEGRLGVLTRATVRIRPIAEEEGFYGAFFRDWSSGLTAVRAMIQANVGISMLRLSDAQETATTLALAGRERLVSWADKALRLLRFGPERCLLIFGVTGDAWSTRRARSQVSAIARQHKGLVVGGTIGQMWRKSRFLTPYLRNTLWDRGYAIDTLETAVPWSRLPETAAVVRAAIENALVDSGEQVLVLVHLSHVYDDGASIYVTYLFRLADDPEQTLERWQHCKDAASRAIVDKGGTISHQHGVGLDHAAYLPAEKGPVGMAWLRSICQAADPDGILNPGKLLPASGSEYPEV